MMDARQPSLEDKVAFFSQLRSSTWEDKEDAGDEEMGRREEALRQRSRAFFFKPEVLPVPSSEGTPAPVIGDAPIRQGDSPGTQNQGRREKEKQPARPHLLRPKRGKEVEVIEDTPAYAMKSSKPTQRKALSDSVGGTAPSGLQRVSRKAQVPVNKRTTSPPEKGVKRLVGNSRAESPSTSDLRKKKKKKDAEPTLVPDHQQVLKGMSLYFVPNDDISPARRIRINKAREHGAAWVRVLAGATHVVADRNIKFKDIEDMLAQSGASGRRPIAVNESYPIECIQFRAVLDPMQKRYQLQGQPVAAAGDQNSLPQSSSVSKEVPIASLPLKAPQNNPNRWDYVPPAGTPVRSSEDSSQLSRIAATPMPTESQPILLDLERISPSASAKDMGDGAPSLQPQDDLSEYIAMMQEYKDLPLDMDDDGTRSVMDASETFSDHGEESGSDTGGSPQQSKVTTRQKWKGLSFEDRFACNQATTKDASNTNPNARTIEILQSMADYYDKVGDHWRTTGYRKAINTLKRQDTKIATEEEAIKLPSIGSRLAQKIEEIVTTDRLKRLESVRNDPASECLARFLGIYGVGTRQAQQWIARGFRTLEDVKENVSLSPNQLVGIEHYDDLNSKIPRREVEALGSVVKKAAARIDPLVELIIGGSYRRRSPSSNDIDFIVTKPGTESPAELRVFLDQLVLRLEKDKFLVARLASTRSGTDGTKWHGCCVLPRTPGVNDSPDTPYKPTWRRIDFLLVPESEMGGALIYFTGNDIFNRSMRLLAQKKGMRLNQRGLYRDATRGQDRVRGGVTREDLIEGRDERRIFEVLGVKWREPHERWC